MPFDFKFYLSIFWRRFPYFLIIATLIGAFGISVASVLPANYRAEARLLIENPQIPENLAASTVRTDAAQEIAVIQQRLTTRAMLLETAARLGVYADNPRTLSPDEIVSDMRGRIRIATSGIGRRGNAPIITVSFQDRSPARAAQVVNEFVTLIERENVEMRRGLAQETLQFFREEVRRLSEEISIQRARILEFRLDNREALPESLEFRRNQAARLEERMRQLNREAEQLAQRREELVVFFEATGRVGTEPSPEERDLARAQEELRSALRLYSETNPRVRVLQARVSELEGAVAARASDDAAVAQFDQMLSRIDDEIAVRGGELAAAETELTRLRGTIDATANVGIRLSELERELSSVQNQHGAATSRLAQAEMGERIELLAKGRRITVLEQATVPRSPTSPNRPVIAAAGVGGGAALGLAFVALLELLNRSIRRPAEITKRMGITPIATLPFVRTRRQVLLRRMVIGAAFLVVLAGVPLALWALHTYYLPLDILVDWLMDRAGVTRLLNSFR